MTGEHKDQKEPETLPTASHHSAMVREALNLSEPESVRQCRRLLQGGNADERTLSRAARALEAWYSLIGTPETDRIDV